MKKIYITFLAVALGMTSCDSYLDINVSPNSPVEENMTPSIVFPSAEMNLAASYGNFLRITGGYFAQHYSHQFGTSNYVDYSRFTMSATRSSGTYSQLYSRCLQNLETVRRISAEDEDWGPYLAATILRAFTFQVLVDTYGEVPYTESLMGNENLTPKYDDGITIYQGILAELDEALAKTDASNLMCTNLLFNTATAENWIKLANAVKLKILMRMSDAENVQSALAALIAENNFPASDVAWTGFWANESGKANPYFQEEFATYFGSTQVNVVANLALVSTMQDSNDTRLNAYFKTNSSNAYTGGVSGTNFSTSTAYQSSYWCRPNISYNSPVYLITKAEIEFFLAEYHARYGSSNDAETHYKAAIEASFATTGVSGANTIYDSETYKWNNANYKQLIGIQKWIALAGTNNFEAWCELRRLKYPAFGSVSGAEIYDEGTDVFTPSLYVPGTLYTPIRYNTRLGANKVLQRFDYAESSSSRNSNTPPQADDHAAKPVFWVK